MNNFKDGGFKKRGNDFGGRPKFGGGGFNRDKRPGGFGGGDRGGRSDGPTEMFTTTCAECRKSCEVPFRPNGEKPVYCRECFGQKNSDGGREDRGGSRGDFGRRDDRGGRADFQKPRQDFGAPQHDAPRGAKDAGLEEVKQQLAKIETRLNRILDLMSPPKQKTEGVVTVQADTKAPEKKEVKAKEVKVEKAGKVAKKVASKAVAVKAPAKKVAPKKVKK